jgi:hypothetical protein
MFKTNRQSHSLRRFWAGYKLAFVALLLGGTASWFAWHALQSNPTHQEDGAAHPASAATTWEDARQPSGAIFQTGLEGVTASSPSPSSSVAGTERSLAELEREFLSNGEKDTQLEAVAQIAGHNTEAAVESLARIFSRVRDSEVKESILARLADIDPEAAPVARITLLERALFGQPRSVRLTAVDLLGQSEDPRALLALRRAAREDSDKLIREAAAAIAEAVGGRPL